MKTLWTQIFTVLAIDLLYLANEWMQGAAGLHPFISIPAACALVSIPYLVKRWL